MAKVTDIHFTLAQVHGASAYYHANREEIEESIADEAAVAEQLERQEHKRST